MIKLWRLYNYYNFKLLLHIFIKVSYTCGAYVTYDHIMHAPHVGVLSVHYMATT